MQLGHAHGPFADVVAKWHGRPMLNFKSLRYAANVFAGIELMHMIRKGGGSQVLPKKGRLSITPVTPAQWKVITSRLKA